MYVCPFTHVDLLKQEQQQDVIADNELPKNCKHCPSCHSPIMKVAGSNVVKCSHCNHCFCWESLHPWDETHKNHFGCPSMRKYNENELEDKNDENPNDMSFHPMPISPEKVIEFSKWCELADLHHKMMVEIGQTKSLYAHQISQMLKDEELATRYINDIIFGKSVIAWGYAELLYIDEKEAARLGSMLHLLQAQVDILVDSIKNPWMKNPSAYFNHNIQFLYQRINDILNFVESVHK